MSSILKTTNIKHESSSSNNLVLGSDGTTSFSDNNITNVGDIALDTISSDAGTSIGVTLGTDAGDDFNVGSGKLVVEGDTGNVGIGIDTPGNRLIVVDSNNRTESTAQFKVSGNGYSAFFFLDATAFHIGQNSSSRKLRMYSGSNENAGVNLSSGGTSWGSYSDERLKRDWAELNNAIEKLSNIRCGTYRFNNDDDGRDLRIGVIAQDLIGKVDECLELGNGFAGEDNQYYLVKYTELIPVLIKAIQELSAKVNALENATN